MIWFKNILVYRFSKPFEINPEAIEKSLNEFRFTPCSSQDQQKVGWQSALGKHSELLSHLVDDNILICAHKEEKMLPTSVVKDALNDKVEILEKEQGRRLKKKRKRCAERRSHH